MLTDYGTTMITFNFIALHFHYCRQAFATQACIRLILSTYMILLIFHGVFVTLYMDQGPKM